MNLDLKQTLKTLKLNESKISLVLGIIIVLAIGTLTVNYFRGKGPKSENKTLSTSISTEETTPTTIISDELQKHVVKKGESLWTISTKYYSSGFEWEKISKENKLKNPSQIEVGQTLVIPKLEKTPESIVKTNIGTKIAPIETDAISKTTYTIAKGDSLWKIAVRAYGDGYKWVQIAKENKLKNPNIIHPGNILILPR